MRHVFRAMLILAVLATGAYLLGYWSPSDVTLGWQHAVAPVAAPLNAQAVRGSVDRFEERAGRIAGNVGAFLTDAELSGKIKSKMALDDLVRARTIDVSTTAGVVTLAGTVTSIAERDQALRLARDTTGVTRVVDRLQVVPASGH
jgi:osmotically-inducible protein OsmY